MARYQRNYMRENLPARVTHRLVKEDKRAKLQQRYLAMMKEGRVEEANGLRKRIITLNLEAVRRAMRIPEKKTDLNELRQVELRLQRSLDELSK